MYRTLTTCIILIGCALFIACNNDTVTEPDPPATAAAKVIEARTSECHGFTAKRTEGEQDETLNWSYDTGTESLSLHHTALVLNCCGVHTVDASYENGIVTVYEDDQPDSAGGRCRCLCPFDFLVTIEGIPSGVTGIRIELTVDNTTTRHWAGAIDLAEGSGSVVITDQTP